MKIGDLLEELLGEEDKRRPGTFIIVDILAPTGHGDQYIPKRYRLVGMTGDGRECDRDCSSEWIEGMFKVIS